jgi:hypothetical protein
MSPSENSETYSWLTLTVVRTGLVYDTCYRVAKFWCVLAFSKADLFYVPATSTKYQVKIASCKNYNI